MKLKLFNERNVDEDIEKDWQEFWVPILYKGEKLDLDQLKKELFDFHFMIGEVPRVYMHVTGGKLSKQKYPAEVVIGEADDHYRNLFEEERSDEIEELEEDIEKLNACIEDAEISRGFVKVFRNDEAFAFGFVAVALFFAYIHGSGNQVWFWTAWAACLVPSTITWICRGMRNAWLLWKDQP